MVQGEKTPWTGKLFFPLCLGQTGVEQQGPSSWSQAWPLTPRGTLTGLTGV